MKAKLKLLRLKLREVRWKVTLWCYAMTWNTSVSIARFCLRWFEVNGIHVPPPEAGEGARYGSYDLRDRYCLMSNPRFKKPVRAEVTQYLRHDNAELDFPHLMESANSIMLLLKLHRAEIAEGLL